MSSLPPVRLFMFTPVLRKPPLWLQAMLVMALAWAGIALLFGRAGWSDWSRPHWLEGDPLEVYARVKIAAEQPGHALWRFTQIERLGAPATADWSAYPVPDRLVFVLTGLLSRVTGLIAAVHLMATIIAGLNAASFYLCARWLRWRWEWAAALGLVFAFCCYNVRWGITLSLNQTFVLPPLVLLCARGVRRAPWVGSFRAWSGLAVALGLWLGFANPYLAFFAGVVAGGALAWSILRRALPRRRSLLGRFLACLFASFLVANASHIVQHARGTTGTVLVRSAADTRTFGLRPADWLVPPADHRVPAMAAIGRGYESEHHGKRELFYNYLGLAGLAGWIGMILLGAIRLLRREWPRLPALGGLAWICAYAMPGGINTWLASAGLDLFRAGTRIGIYALLWSLFFVGRFLTRRSRGLNRRWAVPLAACLAVAAIWEQTPPLADRNPPARNLARWQAMAALTDRLERQLPSDARVFQLPTPPFPEAGPTGRMSDYEHFLPLLTSRSLHFSYGQLRPSPWRHWARYVSRLSVAQMVAALEASGFSALWLDQRAYEDAGAGLATGLRQLGLAELHTPSAALPVWVFRLNPVSPPMLPDLTDPRLSAPWDGVSASLFAVSGWYPLETEGANRWRWAVHRAVAGGWHDGPPATGTLRFRVQAAAGSVVVLHHAGREVWRGRPGSDRVEIPLTLGTGMNLLIWELKGSTFRPGGNDPRELGFMIENLSLSVP